MLLVASHSRLSITIDCWKNSKLLRAVGKVGKSVEGSVGKKTVGKVGKKSRTDGTVGVKKSTGTNLGKKSRSTICHFSEKFSPLKLMTEVMF